MERQQKLNVKRAFGISMAVVALMLAASLAAHLYLPAGGKFPMHWNAAGKVDRYGPRAELLLVFPVTAFLLSCLIAALPRIEPRSEHLMQSRKAYTGIWFSLMLLLAYIHGIMLANALGYRINMIAAGGAAVGLMFAVVGNYTSKLRSNYFAGIRTPWTLSSELSWSKTHRLGGKLFVAYGLAVMVVSIMAPKLLLAVVLTGILIITTVTLVYSWQVWKHDPARKLTT